MSLNNDDELDEAEDKGDFTLGGLKLGINVIIPREYLKGMPYDTFCAYIAEVAREATERIKDAAKDEWFKQQPLYNGNSDGN